MEFVPLPPIVVSDTVQPPVQSDDHPVTLEPAVDNKDGVTTSTTLVEPLMKPVYQGTVLPRIRYDDYYAKLQPVRIENPQDDTTDSDSSDDHHQTPPPSPPPQPIRLDDYYAGLAVQMADVLDEQVEEAMPERPKRKKHKPMTAVPQKQAMETLKAKLMLFPQSRTQLPQPSQPQLHPVEMQVHLSSPPPTPVISSTAKVVKRTKLTSEHKVSAKRGPGHHPGRSGAQPAGPAVKNRKDIENHLGPEVKDVISRLQRLGDPIVKDISDMTSCACAILDKQKDVDEIATQLIEMETDWKGAHDERRKKMITFLERYGIIPMGSVP